MLGKNPYRPGVGTKPRYLAGRERELRRFDAILRSAPEIPANIRLTGLRGVGKTVLLTEFEERAATAGWSTGTMELEPRHNEEEALANSIVNLCKRVRERLSKREQVRAVIGAASRTVRTMTITYSDVSLSFDSSTINNIDLARELFQSVEAALSSGYGGFLLLLDEAQVIRDERERDGEHPLSMLIAAVTALQKNEVPLGLVLCGLPTLTVNLLAARTYSERMFRGEVVESLSANEARDAFLVPLQDTEASAEPLLVSQVLAAVTGYPYFIQLWGAELWDAAVDLNIVELTSDLLAAVEPHIYRRLDTDFFDPRVAGLTPAEQDLLSDAARSPYPPLVVADLAANSPKSTGNVNVLLGRLVQAGVIYRVRKGQYEYTAPEFHEYLVRRASTAGA